MSLQDATRAAAIRGTEPGFPVRLVALDIDGTLVGDDLVVGPRTIAAIRAAKARGVAVSLVTGRMVSSAMRFARELGLTDPIIGYQGGLIRAMPEPGSARIGKLLVHTPLRPATARAVVAWTREHGLDPHLNHLERFILRADDPRADDYSAFMGARAELVPDLLDAIDHPITKILAVGEPPLPTELAPAAAAAFAGVADVTISHPRFLEFVAPGCLEGPGDPAGSPAGSGSRSRRRWPSATNGTTSRCSPRWATAPRCRPHPPRSVRSRDTSPRPSRTRASPT